MADMKDEPLVIKATPDEMFKAIADSKEKGGKFSLLAKYLTADVYKALKDRKTSLGGTLAQCMNSGYENLDSGTGIYVCDAEAYDTFSDLLDPVCKDYHKFSMDKPISHPAANFGKAEEYDTILGNLDPENTHVVSTRVRVGRSADGFAFPPNCSLEDRRTIEAKIKVAFGKLEGEYKGQYYPLTGMDKKTSDQLTADHFLFNNTDRFARAAGVYRNWPDARGIFHNDNKTFLVWVNEEDHYRIISMQMGGDLGAVFKRLVAGIRSIEKEVKFAYNPRLGYVTFCPTNLGTTMRASVHVKVPLLAANEKTFHEICDRYKLQPRGIHGEHTESVGGVYDISNKRRLGVSEWDLIKEMADGVREIIKAEKALEKK